MKYGATENLRSRFNAAILLLAANLAACAEHRCTQEDRSAEVFLQEGFRNVTLYQGELSTPMKGPAEFFPLDEAIETANTWCEAGM